MNWKYLKDNIYLSDGSLRDIYVLNTSRVDWENWIGFVNQNYKIEFKYYDREGEFVSNDTIIFEPIFKRWDGINDLIIDATIDIGGILVKCYFFSEDEIENDITPLEVKSLEHHHRLMEYLSCVSKILNKEVLLTIENYSSLPEKLITVNNDQVLIS
ncbi:hypothetical protein [uncultured Chryseobacterium sp.]|uniref:hypothetical protein n=1 Tax=uncultured Chryseobacterium sp. TaxID=259322 RepID=UPI0025E7A9FF|nr:hypothetical protein [uncultured Chryseobacterium sp.]